MNPLPQSQQDFLYDLQRLASFLFDGEDGNSPTLRTLLNEIRGPLP